LFNIIWRPPAEMTANIKVVGEEYLEQALRADKPLLLVIGHFTPLFHAISKLSTLAPFDVIYRRMNNPVMEANLYQRGAGKYPITLFHRKDIRKMLEKLADNGTVFIAQTKILVSVVAHSFLFLVFQQRRLPLFHNMPNRRMRK
jgi:KDO2-lipid IV(A) lauroyltransferase